MTGKEFLRSELEEVVLRFLGKKHPNTNLLLDELTEVSLKVYRKMLINVGLKMKRSKDNKR